MPSSLPEGDDAPSDGSLPESVREGAESRAFGVYVHVPYCRVRCGYCDFNTYTATELRGTAQADYADLVVQEIAFADEVMQRAELPARRASTVFFGGGTPTLLPSADLAKMLGAIRETWGLSSHAEITSEANPDSVTQASIAALAEAGFTRLSIGMQSSVPNVLATLERTHDPERVPQVVSWAREAGLQVSLDLIYGTPGERAEDWRASLETAIDMEPDHLSAYALIVEPGTKLAAQIRRGESVATDDDLQADFYEMADDALEAAGFQWYEISNWARDDALRSRHNLAYWTGEDWWAAGPGAHSHIGGTRWWNVKHPAAYANRLQSGQSPALAREVLTAESRREERILLETRLADGLDAAWLTEAGRDQVAPLISDGLIDGRAAIRGKIVLTRRGRLLADQIVSRLLGISAAS